MLSQGEPCDAAVNFDSVQFYNGIVRFLYHSTAFLYRPTSATVQMLKLHKVRRHSNFGPILHRFQDIERFCAPDPTPIIP